MGHRGAGRASSGEELKFHAVHSFIEQSDMFSVLTAEQIALVASHSIFERYETRMVLFEEGSPAAGGFIVAQGRVVLAKRTFQGKSLVTELLGTGDPLGIVCAAHGDPYPLGAYALRESVVLRIEQPFLQEFTATHEQFSRHLLLVCKKRLHNSQAIISRLADAKSDVRIGSALMLMIEKFGDGKSASGIVLDTTREEISQIAGVTVETAIRFTRELEDEGVLSFPAAGKIEVLDVSCLQTLCSASS